MIKSPLVSIIIPTYNRAHIIGETLDSIIAQTYTNWECIVVDDGSSDNTAEVMAKYIAKDSRFRYYNRPKDRLKGPCSCRNFGFERSKGDFINFFDSDDLLKPTAFEVWLFNFNEDIDAVISRVEMIHFSNKTVTKTYEISSEKMIEDFFIGKINFFVCGPMWRKQFLKQQESLFNENIKNGDDWDFNLRMLYQMPKLKFLDLALVQIRINPNSLSNERTKLNKLELVSYFNTLELHLKKVKKYKRINKTKVNDYIIYRYSVYLLSALVCNNSKIHLFLFKRLLQIEITQGYYKQFVRTIFGYISFLLFKKGYNFLNFKFRLN